MQERGIKLYESHYIGQEKSNKSYMEYPLILTAEHSKYVSPFTEAKCFAVSALIFLRCVRSILFPSKTPKKSTCVSVNL